MAYYKLLRLNAARRALRVADCRFTRFDRVQFRLLSDGRLCGQLPLSLWCAAPISSAQRVVGEQLVNSPMTRIVGIGEKASPQTGKQCVARGRMMRFWRRCTPFSTSCRRNPPCFGFCVDGLVEWATDGLLELLGYTRLEFEQRADPFGRPRRRYLGPEDRVYDDSMGGLPDAEGEEDGRASRSVFASPLVRLRHGLIISSSPNSLSARRTKLFVRAVGRPSPRRRRGADPGAALGIVRSAAR